jgi:flagella basal body P-ring formation protein FlgA
MRAVFAALLVCNASTVHADSIESIVRSRVAPALSEQLDVTQVYVPRVLQTIDVDPSRVVVELPNALKPGHPSVKVTVAGRAPAWIPVGIAATKRVAVVARSLTVGQQVSADDFTIETRAVEEATPTPDLVAGATVTRELAAGTPVTLRDIALPPPVPRGTEVTMELHRGAIVVRGTATLELAARVGEQVSARLAATHSVVHGTLVGPSMLVVGGAP